MKAPDLCLLLLRYGILTASHAQNCARSDYKRYTGDALPPCTCALFEIQTEVKTQLNLGESIT